MALGLLLGTSSAASAGGGGSVNSPGDGGTAIVNVPGGGGTGPGGSGGSPNSPGTSSGGHHRTGNRGSVSNCHFTYQPAPAYGPGAQLRTQVCGGVAGPSTLFFPSPGVPGAPAAPPPPPPPPSGAQVAQQALASFTLVTPSLGTTSDGGVVRFPQWFWLNAGWAEQSATASLRGVSATVVAQPVRVLWNPGDGTSFACDNPGQPYRGPQDANARPPCSHEFTRASSLEPGRRYQVTARVSYHMTWTSNDGTSGDLGIITSPAGSTSAAVGEIQALNVPNPSGAPG